MHDFGQALLGEMLNSPDLSAHNENTAIVLVGHSMGGIVIKKTLLLARQDPNCQKLLSRIHSMFFLATPHRGADSAQLLRKLLSVSSSKAYVDDITPGSMSSQLINDEFRNAYQDIQLWSFFESVSTSVGMIVDRESAVIGLPGERVQLMNADHRHVCKFDTRLDSNYCSLRNAFVASIESIEQTWLSNKRSEDHSQMQILSRYLGIDERPESELARINQRQTDGSCQWLTKQDSFQNWMGQPASPRFYWLDGEPATGKSTIAGHVIKFIEETKGDCAFFFFRHGDSTKSSIAVLLRSLAWQMAKFNAEVRQELSDMATQGQLIDQSDEGSIWRAVFASRILRLEWRQPCYWVVDAIDECSNYRTLFPFLSKVKQHHPLRIFITGRPLLAIDRLFTQEKLDRLAETISIKNSLEDIRLYLQANAEFLPVEDNEEKDLLLAQILNRSNGNFLWTYLVLQELADTLSVEQAYEVLDTVPNGMDGLYLRILEGLMNNTKNRDIAKAILMWTVCASRPLRIDELKEALRLDLNVTLPRLETRLGSITGNLVYVDGENKAQLAHQTVRSFLTRDHADGLPTHDFTIIRSRDHLNVGRVCLDYLCGPELKVSRFRRGASHSRTINRSAFAPYAVQHFSDHIIRFPCDDASILNDICSFLSSNSLAWIEMVATSKDLTPVVHAARNLKAYLEKCKKYHAPIEPAFQDITAWSTDLCRLVACFGGPLVTNPSSIHFLIPPVCPSASIIHRSFTDYPQPLRVSGLNEDDWDDRLLCITAPGRQPLSVACEDVAFAVGFSDGTARLYDTSTLQEKHTFNHRDQVRLVAFSTTDQHLAAASRKKISLWNCITKGLMWEVKLGDPLLAMSFNEDNSLLVGATRSNSLFFWDRTSGKLVNSFQFSDIDESTGEEHRHARAPTHAALSPGLNLFAVVYRQRPIVLWDLEDTSYIGQYNKDASVYPGHLCFALVFNPKAEVQLVAAAYDDGEIVAFDPWTQRKRASTNANAAIIQGSRDGTILVSDDGTGSMTIYEFETLKALYRIDGDEVGIRGFAFSNDGLRIFDVRGDQCNIWEPPVLVRRKEMKETSSQGSSDDFSVAAPPTFYGKPIQYGRSITTLTALTQCDALLCGREDGTVAVYSSLTGYLLQELVTHANNVAIKFLHMSRSGKLLVSVDISGRILIRSLSIQKGPRITGARLVLDRRASDVVEQILISDDDTKVMVSMVRSDEVWEVQTSQTLCGIKRSKVQTPWQWTQAARASAPLLYFSDGRITIHDWDLFKSNDPLHSVDLCLAGLGDTSIKALVCSPHKSHLCILLAERRAVVRPPILRVWNMSRIHGMCKAPHLPGFIEEGDPEAGINVVPAKATYDQLAKDIKIAIGVHEDALVFLTYQGWICSLKLNGLTEETLYSRHFFVPSRYHSAASSQTMFVSPKGSVFIAYKDQVIVFSSGLDFEEKISWKGDSVTSRLSMRSTLKREISNSLSSYKCYDHV